MQHKVAVGGCDYPPYSFALVLFLINIEFEIPVNFRIQAFNRFIVVKLVFIAEIVTCSNISDE